LVFWIARMARENPALRLGDPVLKSHIIQPSSGSVQLRYN